MDTTMVNISHNIPVFHVFVTFMSKSTVTMRGSREIQEVLPDSLKKADGSLLSLANIGDEDDPKLVILPLAIPFPLDGIFPLDTRSTKHFHHPKERQHAAALSLVLTSSTNWSIAKWKTTMTRSATKQENCCAYHLNPTPKHALFDFVQSLPTNERQQPSPAPMDFAQVSKIMTDAVFKGINLSSESKISGFSNNVEERLKLLGCVQTVFPRKTKLQQQ